MKLYFQFAVARPAGKLDSESKHLPGEASGVDSAGELHNPHVWRLGQYPIRCPKADLPLSHPQLLLRRQWPASLIAAPGAGHQAAG